jgi:large subunit ribosomal protein L22
MLSKQIAGLPIDEAIIQMQFSHKMAGKWIQTELIKARDTAVRAQGARRDKLVVCECPVQVQESELSAHLTAQSWVNKAVYGPKRVDIKGRGRHGIMRSMYCRLVVLLKEGKTEDELREIKFRKAVDKGARSAGLVREDGKLRRKVISGWAW